MITKIDPSSDSVLDKNVSDAVFTTIDVKISEARNDRVLYNKYESNLIMYGSAGRNIAGHIF